MPKALVPLLRLSGVFLLILVGLHWINFPMGFSVAGSVATVLFALCLIEIYWLFSERRNVGGLAINHHWLFDTGDV